MGLVAKALVRPPSPVITNRPYAFGAQAGYLGFAAAYSSNEILARVIDLRADSASEPHIIGRRWRRAKAFGREAARAEIKREFKALAAQGLPLAVQNAIMVRNGFYEEVPMHPAVQLLNNPNPFTSRGQLWATVTMDRDIAGNAFVLKARGALGNPMELWRLRPDRVKVIPDRVKHIGGYEYRVGRDVVEFAAEDVMHFKTRHPLDDYYGMSPIMQIMDIVSLDNFQRTFLRTFFERGGMGPGAILTSETKLSPDAKDEIRERHRQQFGGSSMLELMILDNTKSTYTPMSLNRGLRDALPKEIDGKVEARITMRYGIPGAIAGVLIGYETSSYANQRQAWQVLWDVTMTPLLSDHDDVLNLSYTPEFAGIDEVLFDLSDIKALQEDVDKIRERNRKDLQAGGMFWEDFMQNAGRDPEGEGTLMIPSNMVPVRIGRGGAIEMPEPKQIEAPQAEPAAIVDEVHCACGRWVGRNVNVGATIFCPKCKEYSVA
jgi:HK97 family phage portal protein